MVRTDIKEEINLVQGAQRCRHTPDDAYYSAEENERKRIAADLHDGVGQMMSAAKMNLSVFQNEIPFKTEQQRNSFENVRNKWIFILKYRSSYVIT